MEKEIITREEADVLGLTRYFTGRACRNNHIADRYVNGGACVECINGDKIITDAQRETRVAERQAKIDMERRRIELAEQRLKQRQEEQARRLELAEQRLKQRQDTESRRLELAEQRAQRQEKSTVITDENRAVRGISTVAKIEFVKIKLCVQPNDVTAMRAFIHGLAIMRIPGIRLIDVCPNLNVKHGFVYTFLVHPEDKDLCFQAQDNFERTNTARKEELRIEREHRDIELEKLRREQQEDNNEDPGDTLENLMR